MADPPSDSPLASPPARVDATDEDFLYHLYRGSELLADGQVTLAKGELEEALRRRPQDETGQDLLAGVYFRLGVYPHAIELWASLVRQHSRDVTLRVNLALAYLKTGQHDAAREHLHIALELNPAHARAWGYLGLTEWRAGRLKEAREAFVRGGQDAMARRMEDVIDSTAGAVRAAHDAVLTPREDLAADTIRPPDSEERQHLRDAAEAAIRQFESEARPLTIAPQASTSSRGSAWTTVEPGRESWPLPLRMRSSAERPPALRTVVIEASVASESHEPLVIGPAGELFIDAKDGLFCRLDGLMAVRGQKGMVPVQRRSRGVEQAEILGADRPILRWSGPVAAVMAPPGEGKHVAARLEQGDVLYVRERYLYAFTLGIDFESGRLPLGGSPVALTQLSGVGSVVLALPRVPAALQIHDDEEVRVNEDSLVGWTGRLFPTRRSGTAPYATLAPPLSFRGSGYVLIL